MPIRPWNGMFYPITPAISLTVLTAWVIVLVTVIFIMYLEFARVETHRKLNKIQAELAAAKGLLEGMTDDRRPAESLQRGRGDAGPGHLLNFSERRAMARTAKDAKRLADDQQAAARYAN